MSFEQIPTQSSQPQEEHDLSRLPVTDTALANDIAQSSQESLATLEPDRLANIEEALSEIGSKIEDMQVLRGVDRDVALQLVNEDMFEALESILSPEEKNQLFEKLMSYYLGRAQAGIIGSQRALELARRNRAKSNPDMHTSSGELTNESQEDGSRYMA